MVLERREHTDLQNLLKSEQYFEFFHRWLQTKHHQLIKNSKFFSIFWPFASNVSINLSLAAEMKVFLKEISSEISGLLHMLLQVFRA